MEMDKESKVIIVGNSPTVLNKEYGKLIDSYDVVIRINRCVTKGFEKYIGEKTNIWATSKAAGLKPANPGYPAFVPDNFEKIQSIWYRTPASKRKVKLPERPLDKFNFTFVPSDYVMWKTGKFIKRFKDITDPSGLNMKDSQSTFDTGLLAILTSTIFYTDVTIYGFTFYSESDGKCTAYYRESELDGKGEHPEDFAWNRQLENGFITSDTTEERFKIINKLVEDKTIKIFKED